MDEQIYHWDIGGFYFAISRLSAFIGFAFTCAYIEEEKVFQIMLHIGTVAIALGYNFEVGYGSY